MWDDCIPTLGKMSWFSCLISRISSFWIDVWTLVSFLRYVVCICKPDWKTLRTDIKTENCVDILCKVLPLGSTLSLRTILWKIFTHAPAHASCQGWTIGLSHFIPRKWDANLLSKSQVDYGIPMLSYVLWLRDECQASRRTYLWYQFRVIPHTAHIPLRPRLSVVHLQTLQSFMFSSIIILPIIYQPTSSQHWVARATIHLIHNREHPFNSRILYRFFLMSLLIREDVRDTEGIVTYI